MARTAAACFGVFVSLLLAGCENDPIILGPTAADQGIVIYLHADFTGPSQAIDVDVRDLTRAQGPCSGGAEGEMPSWTRCVSSVRVYPGWSATLYKDDDFKGRSVTITADAPNLRNLPGPCDGTFNDCVTSIRVTRQ
jgi:hypothetical protein